MSEKQRDLLWRAGTLLYGSAWQESMARALGVNHRTVQRWAVGARTPGAETWSALAGLVREQRDDLAALLDELERATVIEPQRYQR